jgi:hypothetical protein
MRGLFPELARKGLDRAIFDFAQRIRLLSLARAWSQMTSNEAGGSPDPEAIHLGLSSAAEHRFLRKEKEDERLPFGLRSGSPIQVCEKVACFATREFGASTGRVIAWAGE